MKNDKKILIKVIERCKECGHKIGEHFEERERKPYVKSARWKEAVKNKTNWSKMMQIVQLNEELKDVRLVSEKMGISPQRIYMILKKAREVLPEYN